MSAEDLTQKLFRLYPWILLIFILTLILAHFIYISFMPLLLESELRIERGLDVREVAQLLEKNKIIRSSFYFVLWQKLIFPQEKIKAGDYQFSGSYNLIEVVKILKRGKGVLISIPEGKTAKEIEAIFARSGIKVSLTNLTLADFPEVNLAKYFPATASLEGFLAPDSYHFYPASDEKTIILNFLKNFQQKYLPEILKSDLTPYQTLILASIVEKEAKLTEDFPIIAGILKKRLKNKIPLGVDAPIVYIICGKVYCVKKFSSKSLPKEHPFQTYGKPGLPPAPIANPGLKAIRAVIKPVETKFWYYLTNKEGKAIYAETLEEHQKNIQQYLK